MKTLLVAGVLMLTSYAHAEEDNSAIYEEAILPSFADTNYYQRPQVSADFELDIMVDGTRFGAELKLGQSFGQYFSIVESATYYASDTAAIDNDKQFIFSGGGLFTPLKTKLLSPFIQIDLGYLGWLSEQTKWTGSPFVGHKAGIKLNLTKHFGLLVQRRDMYLTRAAPQTLQGRDIIGQRFHINDVSFVYQITI